MQSSNPNKKPCRWKLFCYVAPVCLVFFLSTWWTDSRDTVTLYVIEAADYIWVLSWTKSQGQSLHDHFHQDMSSCVFWSYWSDFQVNYFLWRIIVFIQRGFFSFALKSYVTVSSLCPSSEALALAQKENIHVSETEDVMFTAPWTLKY